MHANHMLNEGIKAAKNGPPVKPGKSAFAAFLAGFLFGPFGTGIYLESFQDFLVPFLILVGVAFFTAGVGAPVAWMFCGVYGAARVSGAEA